MQPLVSIIIPTYNRAHFLGATLDSVLAQSYPNWECIVVDDGSLDETDKLMEFYLSIDPRFYYYNRPQDRLKGANACRNYGWEKSKGEFIKWFDSDDKMHSKILELQLLEFEKEPEADLCLCEYSLHDHSFNLLLNRPYEVKNLLIDYLTERAFFNFPTSLIRKTSLKFIRLNEQLRKAQEVEFFIRFLQKSNLKYVKVNQNLVFVRLHKDNITSDFINKNISGIKSEMKVRLMSLEYIKEKGETKDLFCYLNIYQRVLNNILNQKLFHLYFYYSISLFFHLDFKYFLRIGKLLIVGIAFIFIGQRPHRFRKVFEIKSQFS